MKLNRVVIAILFVVSIASAHGLSIDMSLSGGPTTINSERWYQGYENTSLFHFGTATSPYVSNAHSVTAVTLGRSGATRKTDGVEAYAADFAIGSTGVVQAFDSVGMEYDAPNQPASPCESGNIVANMSDDNESSSVPETQDFEGMVGMVGAGPNESVYRSAVSLVGKQVYIGAKRNTDAGYIYTDVHAGAHWGRDPSNSVLNAGYIAREHVVSATNGSANISEQISIDWNYNPEQG